jgi:hypothetical protein
MPIAVLRGSGLLSGEVMNQKIATDGHRVLIGTSRGAALLFDPLSEQQLAQFIMPNRGGDSLATAIDGNFAVVGNGRNGAYVLDLTDPTQITSKQLIPADNPGSTFGQAVDLDGDTVIVGAVGDASAGNFTGAAYLFDRDTGSQIAKLMADDKKAGDNFGIDVALDGSLAVIGSSRANHSTGENKGAVYLFDVSPNFVGNRQLDKYTASPVSPSDRPGFGFNVDISGDEIVALENFGFNLGPARGFFWSTDEEPQQVPGFAAVRESGRGLAIDGNYFAIGNYFAGQVLLYDTAGTLRARIDAPPQVAEFGINLALGGDLLIVNGYTQGEGRAYVYSVSQLVIPEPSTWTFGLAALALAVLYRAGCPTASRSRATAIAR